jgi:hypothetical protein
VPDDPYGVVEPLDPVRARLVAAAELGAAARPVAEVPLGDRDLVERLAGAQRNVAVGAAEVADVREDDVLGDDEAAVARDLDDDVAAGEREGLRGRVPGERESAQERD